MFSDAISNNIYHVRFINFCASKLEIDLYNVIFLQAVGEKRILGDDSKKKTKINCLVFLKY